jgi:DNA adenine methylase
MSSTILRTNVASSLGYKVPPFLKWAGGKRWLVGSGLSFMPKEYNNYLEPFLGSGALFFSARPKGSVLADINLDLIETYNAIKTDWKNVDLCLRKHAKLHGDTYYYKVRASTPRKPYSKAARFIYLNRTCWNGLYRVNLKGEFNVPKGTKENVLLESDDFEAVSDSLKSSKIKCQDFQTTIRSAREGDFVYVDPPYTVKHNTNGFLKYNEKIFSWDDQVCLRDVIEEASNRGVQFTISNANHSSIHELYKDIADITFANRKSVISGDPKYRGQTSELIIRIGWK